MYVCASRGEHIHVCEGISSVYIQRCVWYSSIKRIAKQVKEKGRF